MVLSDLATPQVLIDRHRLLNNISRVQDLAARAGMTLRPHTKTHKSPLIARWQTGTVAGGICCAKLGEAEVMVAAGFDDVRLPYPIHPSNLPRLLALMDRAAVSIIVDHLGVAEAWSEAMQHVQRRLDVLVKVDVGFHRCGIEPGEGAVAFLHSVSRMRGLRLRGLLSHAGHAYLAGSDQELRRIAAREGEILAELRADATRAGLAVEECSVGATPTLRYSAEQPGISELRPGNYVYYDRTQVALGAATLDDCALTVLATVVSKPAADRIILDCGSKTLTTDVARGFSTPSGYGAVLSQSGAGVDESLSIERLSEEHATVRVIGKTPLVPGDRVRVLPNHSCVVANMVDLVHLVDGDEVLESLPVAARGKIA